MSQEIKTSFVRGLKDAATKLAVSELTRHKDKLLDIVPRFAQGFDAFFELYKNSLSQGYYPILYSNHQSHADVLVHTSLADSFTYLTNIANPDQKFPGFYLPYATSVGTGDQGTFLSEFLKQFEPSINDRSLYLLPYTRQKDSIQYGTQTNNVTFLRSLVQVIRQGYGLSLLPEASVQGGRKNPQTGTIYGMQPFTGVDFEQIIKILDREGKKPVFIAIGIHGTYIWQSPEKRRANLGPAANLLLTHKDLPLLHVLIGNPFVYDSLESISRLKNIGVLVRDYTSPAELTEVLAQKVAMILPNEARGFFV